MIKRQKFKQNKEKLINSIVKYVKNNFKTISYDELLKVIPLDYVENEEFISRVIMELAKNGIEVVYEVDYYIELEDEENNEFNYPIFKLAKEYPLLDRNEEIKLFSLLKEIKDKMYELAYNNQFIRKRIINNIFYHVLNHIYEVEEVFEVPSNYFQNREVKNKFREFVFNEIKNKRLSNLKLNFNKLIELIKKSSDSELLNLLNEYKEVKERIFNSNLRLVLAVCRNYINKGLSIIDLVDEGCYGLMKAIDKFDVNSGYKFSTYAVYWIRQAILNALNNQSSLIRIPVHTREKVGKIIQARNYFITTFKREPTISELSELTGLSENLVSKLTNSSFLILSLDYEYDKNSFSDNFAYDSDNLEREIMIEKLYSALDKLPEKERMIIVLRHFENKDYDEIGNMLNMSKDKIRSIEAKAIAKLKRMLKNLLY